MTNEVEKKEQTNDLQKDYVDRVFAKAAEGLERLSESYQNISQMETELVTRIEKVETTSSSIQSQMVRESPLQCCQTALLSLE